MAQWCLDFDGVNDYVACGDVPTGGVANLTVEAWVRLDAAEAGGIVAKFVTTTAEEWKLEVDASRIVSFTVSYDGGKTTTVTAPAALTLGTWYHVAAVLDSDTATCRLYVDGEEVDFEALSGGASADNLVSNCMPTNYWPVNYWADMPAVSAIAVDNTAQPVEFGRLNGVYASMRLAWVRISDTVRYDAPFTPPKSPAFPDANTLAQWDFIEGTGTSLNNREATAAYDGVISGATWRWDAPERSDLWGGAYERFGDAWTILIEDVDRTAVVALDSIELVAQIGSNRDTAVFRMEDVAASVAAASWDHVQIWHGGSLEFGGFVVATDKMPTGINLDVVCHCVDWTALLDKRVIAARTTWTAATAKTILKDITELGYVTEFDATTHSEDGATGLDIENDYGYVGDLVKKLAEASGFYWFVREDEEGVVYLYFSDDVAAAPFGLSTAPDMATTFPLRVYQWSESGADLVNHFFLVVEGVPDTATYTTGGTLGNVVTILDRTVVEVLNSPSITAYGFLDATVSVDADEKELYTTAYLTSLGEPRISGRIEIRFPGGARPGMTISVVHSVLDVNDSYLVHQVRTRPLGGGAIRYELTVSNRVREKQNSFSTWRQVQNRLEIANRRRTENWVKKA